jgi:uncharacterized protein YecE (DUF72 family)
MRAHVGTSGFSFDGWKGTFYPAGMPSSKFLAHYATKLSTVEINNTFYKLPNEMTLGKWACEVPEAFTFALKASRFITHMKKLKGGAETIPRFWGLAGALGSKRGPVLVQLPANMTKDVAALEEFLALLPDGHRAAFEFRHPSWFDDDVVAALRGRGAALVYSEGFGDDGTVLEGKLEATAEWGYMRLRQPEYSDAMLRDWAKRLRDLPWKEAWVFFKHEDDGGGPKLAARLRELVG